MRPELKEATNLLRSTDPSKLDEALRLLQRTVYSFSMKVCGHREDAEDTMQEVLLKSLPYLAKLKSPEALAVWLYKVTRNRCWMSRRRSKFAPHETLALDDLMPDSAELDSLTSAPDRSPEQQTVSAQESSRVREAVLRIPPNYRFILVLHDMEGLDTSEVSKVTGLQEGTVRVRLHRARLFVRRELAGEGVAADLPRDRKASAAKPANCREIFANLSEYVDSHLDDATCEKMRKHLQFCPPCEAFVADLRRAIERCRQDEGFCEPATAEKLRNLLVQEYLQLSQSETSEGRSSTKV